MLFIASKIVALFLDPILWFVSLLLSGFLWKKKWPDSKWPRRFKVSAWVIFFVFSSPIVLELGWRVLEAPVSKSSDISEPYDYAIVLGGYSDVFASSEEQLVLGSDGNRLIEAIRLYKIGKVKKLVLTGGTGALFGNKALSESAYAAAFLSDLGIPPGDVLVEPSSRNTKENAVNTAALLGPEIVEQETVLLITSAFHLPRAIPTFEGVGFKVDPYATDARVHGELFHDFRALLPNPWALAEWRFLLKEWVGYVAYKLLY